MKSIKFSSDVSWTKINEEVFVFDEDTNQIYLLKGKSKMIWELINKSVKISEIVEKVSISHKIDKVEAEKEISKKIQQFLDKKLCKYSEEV